MFLPIISFLDLVLPASPLPEREADWLAWLSQTFLICWEV